MKIGISLILPLLFACGAILGAEAPEPFGGVSPYRVLVLGDLHFDGGEFHPSGKGNLKERERNLRMWKELSPKLLKAARRRADSAGAGFVIQLGDITQGDCDTTELHRKMIEKAFAAVKSYFPKTPLAVIKGNHDARYFEKRSGRETANAVLMPLVAGELRMETPPNGNYAFRHGRDLFIAVDGFIPAEECIAFVEKTLRDNSRTRYVFLLTHLPVIPATASNAFWLLPGHYRIAELLEKRRAVILAAHTHIPSFATRTSAGGKLAQLIVSSVGCSWESKIVPGSHKNWQSLLKSAEKINITGKNAAKNRKRFQELRSKGTYTFKQLFYNSGFVVLHVNDRRVEARYYTNDSSKPASNLTLVENRGF